MVPLKGCCPLENMIQVHKRERPQSDRYPLIVDAKMTLNGKKITGELVLSFYKTYQIIYRCCR